MGGGGREKKKKQKGMFLTFSHHARVALRSVSVVQLPFHSLNKTTMATVAAMVNEWIPPTLQVSKLLLLPTDRLLLLPNDTDPIQFLGCGGTEGGVCKVLKEEETVVDDDFTWSTLNSQSSSPLILFRCRESWRRLIQGKKKRRQRAQLFPSFRTNGPFPSV